MLAKEAGLSYAAIAMPTDYDCWKGGQIVDVAAVMEVTLTAIRMERFKISLAP